MIVPIAIRTRCKIVIIAVTAHPVPFTPLFCTDKKIQVTVHPQNTSLSMKTTTKIQSKSFLLLPHWTPESEPNLYFGPVQPVSLRSASLLYSSCSSIEQKTEKKNFFSCFSARILIQGWTVRFGLCSSYVTPPSCP